MLEFLSDLELFTTLLIAVISSIRVADWWLNGGDSDHYETS